MNINDEIIKIKDVIAANADCEQVYLFGSYAYGQPREDSDYDFYVVLNDNAKLPMLVAEDISWSLAQAGRHTPVDILTQYRSAFEERSQLLTLENTIINEGVLLYDKYEPDKAVV